MKILILFSFLAATTLAKSLPQQRESVPNSRIILGYPADNGQFPHQVFLHLSFPTFKSHCGGSIISPTWILTAAHCVDHPEITGVTVHMGDVFHAQSPTVIKAKTLITHPEYNHPAYLENDIALIELSEPITFTDNIKPIKLATTDSSLEGEMSLLSGFGKWDDNIHLPSDRLNYVGMKVISNPKCKEYAGSMVVDSSLCAEGLESPLQGGCSMDSGGPLILRPYGEEDIQIGVVSAGPIPCKSDFPTLFARVSKYINWIKDTTNLDL